MRKDPLDTPLPCDVTIAHITFRKGCTLRTLLSAATRWHADAQRLWDIEHPGGRRVLKEIYGKAFKA